MSKGINLTMARLFQQQLVTNNASGLLSVSGEIASVFTRSWGQGFQRPRY